MISNIFNTILVYPLLNLLVFFYNYIPDLGIAIVVLTVVVRLILLPSFHKSLKHQKIMQDLQPKLDEIRKQYKDDQQKQAEAMMALWRAHKVNPLSSLSGLFIQIPILLALFIVFRDILKGGIDQYLYSFIQNPGAINPMFLGTVDLSQKGNIWMAVIAAVLQYFQSRMMVKKNNNQEATAKMMANMTLYVFPVLTFWIGLQFPAGLPLYWITQTIFGIVQQYYLVRKEAKEVIEEPRT